MIEEKQSLLAKLQHDLQAAIQRAQQVAMEIVTREKEQNQIVVELDDLRVNDCDNTPVNVPSAEAEESAKQESEEMESSSAKSSRRRIKSKSFSSTVPWLSFKSSKPDLSRTYSRNSDIFSFVRDGFTKTKTTSQSQKSKSGVTGENNERSPTASMMPNFLRRIDNEGITSDSSTSSDTKRVRNDKIFRDLAMQSQNCQQDIISIHRSLQEIKMQLVTMKQSADAIKIDLDEKAEFKRRLCDQFQLLVEDAQRQVSCLLHSFIIIHTIHHRGRKQKLKFLTDSFMI